MRQTPVWIVTVCLLSTVQAGAEVPSPAPSVVPAAQVLHVPAYAAVATRAEDHLRTARTELETPGCERHNRTNDRND